jgi:hypothetical protein
MKRLLACVVLLAVGAAPATKPTKAPRLKPDAPGNVRLYWERVQKQKASDVDEQKRRVEEAKSDFEKARRTAKAKAIGKAREDLKAAQKRLLFIGGPDYRPAVEMSEIEKGQIGTVDGFRVASVVDRDRFIADRVFMPSYQAPPGLSEQRFTQGVRATRTSKPVRREVVVYLATVGMAVGQDVGGDGEAYIVTNEEVDGRQLACFKPFDIADYLEPSR